LFREGEGIELQILNSSFAKIANNNL
jgi:hypothetical protein